MNCLVRRCAPVASIAAAATVWWLQPISAPRLSTCAHSESSSSPAIGMISSPESSSNTSASASPSALTSSTSVITTSASQSQTERLSGSRLLFLGSGSSTGCPKPLCSLLFSENSLSHVASDPHFERLQQLNSSSCKTSRLAMQGDPRDNKDYRNNPSILVQYSQTTQDTKTTLEPQIPTEVTRNIIFDVGKTFRETALRWLPRYNVNSLDAIVLTHHHMDAVAGLDDLRGFQVGKGTPVYLSQECLDQVSRQFPWLFPNQIIPTKSAHTVPRHVASLDIHLIQEFTPFDVFGLKVTPLPVWHGDDLICLGYAFSLPSSSQSTAATNIVYLSDISRMKDETLDYIQSKLPPIDILIVDALLMDDGIHPVHFNLPQAVALARQLGAKKTFLVGMSCESFLSHNDMNSYLRQHYTDIDIMLAHDGLLLEL